MIIIPYKQEVHGGLNYIFFARLKEDAMFLFGPKISVLLRNADISTMLFPSGNILDEGL